MINSILQHLVMAHPYYWAKIKLRKNKRLHNNAPLFQTYITDNSKKYMKFIIFTTKLLDMFLKK